MSPSIKRIHLAAIKLFAERDLTSIQVSDLAEAAGVARGTIYNNIESIDQLFEAVAAQLTTEMHERVDRSFVGEEDPARRVANGIRLYVRRTHVEPQWGRFVTRFALSGKTLLGLWEGPLAVDLADGLDAGRFAFSREQISAAMAMTAGTTLASMRQVLEGVRTWRECGTDAAELVLRGLGVEAGEAARIARGELPDLMEI